MKNTPEAPDNLLIKLEMSSSIQQEKIKELKKIVTHLIDENNLRDKGYARMDLLLSQLEEASKNTVEESYIIRELENLTDKFNVSINNIKEIFNLKLAQNAKALKQWIALAAFVSSIIGLIIGLWI